MLRSDNLALNRHVSVTYKTKRSKERFVNQCFTGLPGLDLLTIKSGFNLIPHFIQNDTYSRILF